MPLVQYSKRDLLRDKLVAPGWYRVAIETVGEWTPSADKQSQNMIIEGSVLFNADNGSEEFKDVPVGGLGSWSFNTKGMGFSLGLLKALAPQLGIDPESITENSRYDFKHFEGKQVDVFIENSEYQGRFRNKINHQYRAPNLELKPQTT